jgi:hypothetical protein
MKKASLLASIFMLTTTLFGTSSLSVQGIIRFPILVPMPYPEVGDGYSDSWSANCRREGNAQFMTRPQIYACADQHTCADHACADRIVLTAHNPQALEGLVYQVCENHYYSTINSRRLTFEETVMFKERQKCCQ